MANQQEKKLKWRWVLKEEQRKKFAIIMMVSAYLCIILAITRSDMYEIRRFDLGSGPIYVLQT